MKKRLTLALAAGALVAALLPGAVSAAGGPPSAETSGFCKDGDVGSYFGGSTETSSLGEVISRYRQSAATCDAGSQGTLTFDGEQVASFVY